MLKTNGFRPKNETTPGCRTLSRLPQIFFQQRPRMSECSDSTAIWRFPARDIWLLLVLRKILNRTIRGCCDSLCWAVFSLLPREGRIATDTAANKDLNK